MDKPTNPQHPPVADNELSKVFYDFALVVRQTNFSEDPLSEFQEALSKANQAIRTKYISREAVEQLAKDFDLPSITKWKQGNFIDSRRYSHMSKSWKSEQRIRESTIIRPGGGTNNGLLAIDGGTDDRSAQIAAYLEALGDLLRRELGLEGSGRE